MTTIASAADEQDQGRNPVEVVDSGLPSAGAAQRVASVDALRGLTIFTMVFVNDLGKAAPSWLHHIQPPRADGMTLADIVFPSFLFIVGLSIPLAFERARKLGLSRWAQLRHILGRTAALLLMGVIELNHEEDLTLGGRLWGLLAFTCLILAWCSVPREPTWKRKVFMGLKILGAVGLVILLAIYRRAPEATDVPFFGHVEHWVWLRTGWWGILGLIGWAYLTVSLLTLFLGNRREWLMGAMALLMVMHLATRDRGLFDRIDDKPWLGASRVLLKLIARGVDGIEQYVVGLGDATGSLAAVTMAGCLLGSILIRDSLVASHRDRIVWAATFVVGLLVAGALTDTFEGINKIGATPTWCFWCAAIAASVWIILYLVMDVAGYRAWSIVIRPAGANPLVAYFLHPITIWVVGLAGFGSTLLGYSGSKNPWVVVGGSAAMALFVSTAAGLLGRLGLRVRL
jgi:heparan-alpha-glucosaminide N-acetyltransferase